MAATAMATETTPATEEVRIFLKKNHFFHHALSFLFVFLVLYCIMLIVCMIEYEMNRKFDRFLGFRRGTVEKWELKYKPRNASINRETLG